MNYRNFLFSNIALSAVFLFFLVSCDSTNNEDVPLDDIYPMYVDNNENGVNDYFEMSSHDNGDTEKAHLTSSVGLPDGPAPAGHAFVDENGDGICDYAQNGSATWHGPGFVDNNGNGICDYWDEVSPRHRQHNGMQFHDHNGNQINDYFEEVSHQGPGHAFVDKNGDGICDRAQDGSPTWHGPSFIDEDKDGRCDYWQPGGRGHGRHHS